MTDEAKAVEVFKAAVARTHEGGLPWELSGKHGPGNVFECRTPTGFILRMYPYTSVDDDGTPEGLPSLTLYDDSDELIFDIKSGVGGVTASELSNLYAAARGFALGIPAKLDAILKDLGTMTPPGQ